MARPKKATVDYFPHDCYCLNKQTLFILDQKFGNDGYSFWWKLLEILGKTENHFINCRNNSTWEFLQAQTHLNDVQCTEILDLLSGLGAIDSKLWDHHIIWSDNFVKAISDVYKNRRVETPSRPILNNKKSQSNGVSTNGSNSSNDNVIVSTNENPQSKVKETKVNNIYSENSDEFHLSKLIFDLILIRNPSYKKPNLQNWCIDISKLLNIDMRGRDEVEKVIRWSQANDFWKNNILSTAKLRQQYDQLKMKMEQENPKRYDEKGYDE